MLNLTQDWPLVCSCTISYPEPTIPTSQGGLSVPPGTFQGDDVPWVEKEVGIVNMIATNLPKLGVDNPICKGCSECPPFCNLLTEVCNDDGTMAVAIIDESTSLKKTVQAALGMKQVRSLSAHLPDMLRAAILPTRSKSPMSLYQNLKSQPNQGPRAPISPF